MPISKKVEHFMTNASFIRRMFEEGIRLRQQFGAQNVFDFSLGNPILEPPEAVVRLLRQLALEPPSGLHRYMPNAGLPEARARIAAYLKSETGQELVGDDILLSTGAAGALNAALKALLDPGDQVIVVAPFFPEYRFYVDNHGGELVIAESAEDFDLDLGALEAALTPRTKAIILNSPNNPTGRMYSAERWAELGTLLARHEGRVGQPISVLADDPYRKIVYDGLKAPHPFAAHPNTIWITSHSKDLGLAGERIGYAAIHPAHRDREALRGAMTFVNRTLGYVNAPATFQRVVAETQAESVPVEIYQKLRDLFYDGLLQAGYQLTRPEGAFYLFPRTPLADDVAFVKLLVRHRVLAVPGTGFGRPGYMRLAYSVTEREVRNSLPAFAAALAEAKSG